MSETTIVPGKGSGIFRLGVKFSDLSHQLGSILSSEERDGFIVHKTDNIWFFVNLETDVVEQFSFLNEYKGKVLGKVGLGDSLGYVHQEFGKCTIDNKVHEPIEYPGVYFEMVNGSKSKAAQVEVISIMEPYHFTGELPTHIKDNLSSKKRLP